MARVADRPDINRETLRNCELDAVLTHEATHIRRRHPLHVLLAHALLTPLPQIRRWPQTILNTCRLQAEVQADVAATNTAGLRPLASALLKLAAPATPDPLTGAASLLSARVAYLNGTAPTRRQSSSARWAIVAVALASLAAAVAPVTHAVEGDQPMPSTATAAP